MNQALKSALTNFSIRGNELCWGDMALSELAREHGTPLYIYFERIIQNKQQLLRNLLPENLHFYYAVKANPNPDILKIMGNFYDGFDVASAGELKRVLDAGFPAEVISFAGPGKSREELRFAIHEEIGCISVESQQEFEHIVQICSDVGKKASVSLRINPDFDLSGSGMKMGGGPKQFGVDTEKAPAILAAMADEPCINFKGIHIFAGSQNLHSEALLSGFENILKYAVSLQQQTGIPIQWINMGGGFGIPYFAHEHELDLEFLGKGLDNLLKQYSSLLGYPKFILELGRYLVGDCGAYLTEVLYKKRSKEHIFLIMNGGMHHHLAASGNLGQSLARRPMPLTVVNRQNFPVEKVHVVGPLCTPLDTFGFVEIPRAEAGDIIGVFQSGAYGFSASPQLFLSHPAPKEVVIPV